MYGVEDRSDPIVDPVAAHIAQPHSEVVVLPFARVADLFEGRSDTGHVVPEDSTFRVNDVRVEESSDIAVLVSRALRLRSAVFHPLVVVARAVEEQTHVDLALALRRLRRAHAGHRLVAPGGLGSA